MASNGDTSPASPDQVRVTFSAFRLALDCESVGRLMYLKLRSILIDGPSTRKIR